MFVFGVWQVERAIVWFPIFDQSIVESGCHLVDQVTGSCGRGTGLFSSVDQLLRLVIFEFSQNFA